MKRLKLVQNLAMISPIGNQFAEKETSRPQDLQHTYEGVNTELKITDSDPTTAYTDANLIYSNTHEVAPGATTNAQEQANVIKGMFTADGIRPYAISINEYYLAPLGVTTANLWTGTAGGTYDVDTEYTGDRFFASGQHVRAMSGTKLSSPDNISTLYASVYAMLNNADVKVVLAYNRSLDWNTYSENSQIASMWAYHADCFSLLALFDILSGVASFNYKANEISKINYQSTAMYAPDLYAAMLTAARELANLPILDKQTAEFIQITTKYYSANKDVYYPGSFIYFDAVLPTGFAGGSTAGATGSYKNITFANADTNFCAYSGLTTYRQMRNAIANADNDVLIEHFNAIKTMAQAISRVYRPVIQVLVQMNAKGIYTPETIDKYLDFVIGDEDNGGIIIYDITKDYYVNNLLKFAPQIIVQNDQNPALSLIVPTAINNIASDLPTNLAYSLALSPQPHRLFGPFEMADDVYDTQELLGCMVYKYPNSLNGVAQSTVNPYTRFLQDAVTGTGVSVGAIIVTFNTSWGGAITTPGVAQVTNALSSLSLIPKLDQNPLGAAEYNICSNTFLGDGNLRRFEKGMVCDAILSQFDMKYCVERVTPVAAVEDNDALHTAFFNDEYFMPIPASVLETANASYYTHIMDKVTWMDKSSKAKDRYKSDKEKSAGESSDK